MDFIDLTEEQKKQARETKTVEELAELGVDEGGELSGAKLDGVSAGRCTDACGQRYPIGI